MSNIDLESSVESCITNYGSLFSRFQDAYHAGRLGHAYLLIGDPRGNAGELAEKIVCLLYCNSEADRPCLKCVGCENVLHKNIPDTIWCEPKNRSRTIDVKQIEEVQEFASKTANSGCWKVVVFLSAKRMH
ncbi:MAG: hypothetical protein GX811_05575 [Lentisphaerae bacterium]|nr:hypothetical protein [Lentisphaerota bacterium]